MTKLYNTSDKEKQRKYLRKNMTPAEREFWSIVRNRSVMGYKFRRQYSIGKYILDFYCVELKLAIEIDGSVHYINEDSMFKDKEREDYISMLGIRVLRFTNNDMQNKNGVYLSLTDTIKEAVSYTRQF